MKKYYLFLLVISLFLFTFKGEAQSSILDIGIVDVSTATEKLLDVRIKPTQNVNTTYTGGIFTLRVLKNTASLSIVSGTENNPYGYSFTVNPPVVYQPSPPSTNTTDLYDYYVFSFVAAGGVNIINWSANMENFILKLKVNIPSGVGTTIDVLGLEDDYANSRNGTYYQELNSDSNGAQKGIFNATVLFSALLPVELISFTAEKKEQASLIKWETVSEKDLLGYFIERSADGKNFHIIDYVEARAKSETERLSYQTIDKKPELGINYYRLQTKEKGKEKTISKIVSVDFGDGLKSKTYPNPFSAELNIEIDIQENVTGDVLVDIIDVSGKQVYTKKVKMEGRKLAFSLPTENLVSGSYVIRIESGGRTWHHKITKQ